jgi:hypothetical protein
MRRVLTQLILLLYALLPVTQVCAQNLNTRKAEITSLAEGEAIRGIVTVSGNTLVERFVSWELNFSYAEDTTGTWFLIAESDETVDDGLLAEWDTTTITDGNYNLRLTISLEEDRRTHFTVQNLRVRNYTPIETNTPIPTTTSTPFTVTPQPSPTPTQTLAPTETPYPNTPTPLPTNPIEISTAEISHSLVRGVAGVLAAFLVLFLYSTMRKAFRKSG